MSCLTLPQATYPESGTPKRCCPSNGGRAKVTRPAPVEEYDVSRHLGSLVLAAALLLTAAACSDDAPEEPDATSAPTSDSSSSTPETSAPPTTEPPTPTVTPASGLALRQGRLSVRAPEGWKKTPEPVFGQFSQQADYDPLLGKLFMGELPDLSGGAVTFSIDEQARMSIESGQYRRDPEIVAPVEIDGRQWYHTSGPIDAAQYEDALGTNAGGYTFKIALTTGVGLLSPAEREALLASILATVELDVD